MLSLREREFSAELLSEGLVLMNWSGDVMLVEAGWSRKEAGSGPKEGDIVLA
jgi:hypothetical protein